MHLARLYIAQEEGLFAKQGLHVTLEKIASNQAAVAAQLKGQVDISAQSYVKRTFGQAAVLGSASWPRHRPSNPAPAC